MKQLALYTSLLIVGACSSDPSSPASDAPAGTQSSEQTQPSTPEATGQTPEGTNAAAQSPNTNASAEGPGPGSSNVDNSLPPTKPDEQPPVSQPPADTNDVTGVAGGNPTDGTQPDEAVPPTPVTETDVTAAQVSLEQALQKVADLDAAGFAERTKVTFEELGYDPAEAIGLDLIKNSELGMTDAELAKFEENGFVITTRAQFPNFSYGYQSIYNDDLPVYVSADSILYALHTSYDLLLKSLEGYLLLPEVASIIENMHSNLAASSLDGDIRSDLDVYLSVADSLLAEELKAPQDSANAEIVSALFDGCMAAAGQQQATLFGSSRDIDFSQFSPRGHYTDSKALGRYFRAMMWMGRIDLRLMEPAGSELVLNRRQAEAAIALRTLMDDGVKSSHQKVDDVISAFVGEHDTMTPTQVDDLMADLQVTSLADLENVSDAALAQAITDGGYGQQRIASHIMTSGLGGTRPLAASLALFGQRYVIDSHVFSNVVFDRVKGGSVERMLPDPLDAAYAALQNDQAGMLLESELQTYDYASDLASMRTVVDSEPPAFWQQNLYNRWLGALRTLSPAHALADGEGLPQIAKTAAWGRRLLNTQLASWAELRHDTILYTKQSYTSASQCEYPDAYVEPYPEFFDAIVGYAGHALEVIAPFSENLGDPPEVDYSDFESVNASLAYYALTKGLVVLQKFVEVGGILGDMAREQRTGAPHSAEHIAFINQAVATHSGGCGIQPYATGWYADLFVDGSLEFAPTIADVHTQPTTPAGGDIGRILHVGTGNVRLIVTSVDTCAGPHAYAGLVSSYYEVIQDNWKRLTDPEWEDILKTSPPQSPVWVTSLMQEEQLEQPE